MPFQKKLKLFLSLFAGVLSTIRQAMGVQHQCAIYPSICHKDGLHFPNHTLSSFIADQELVCHLKCNLDTKCKSYNYKIGLCQLNDAEFSHPSQLKKKAGFVYVGVKGPCKDSLPTVNERCKANISIGMENRTLPDEYITASSRYSYLYYPSGARLNGPRGWTPNYSQNLQWLQINVGKIATITGIATQGLKDLKKNYWVQSFTLKYRTDNDSIYHDYKKVFKANVDKDTAVFHSLNPPIIARYVRVLPSSWNIHIGLRMDLYEQKCKQDPCSYALGMQSKSIQNHQVTASYTEYMYAYPPWNARLDGNDAWVISNGVNSWLQINLIDVKKVTGIATQGTHRVSGTFVKEYELVYSNNTSSFLKYSKSFQGNIDNVGIVYNSIEPPIIASVIRILPTKFNLGSFLSLRVELYGCPYVGAWQGSN